MNIDQSKYFKNMFIKDFVFDKKRKIISKGFLKIRFNFDNSKVHNYHLLKIFKKDFTPNFIIS
jgi:hypothetical protein